MAPIEAALDDYVRPVAYDPAVTFVPGLGWDNFWWLIFIPLVISMVLGRSESERERERRRIEREQERLDQRRRAIGD